MDRASSNTDWLGDRAHVEGASTDKTAPLLRRLCDFLQPETYDTTYLTHGIHPYSAKFIPQLPQLIVREHTNERHVVLDPFCGSGTTLLECALLGRRSIGVDSNPIAALVSRAKTFALSQSELGRLRAFSDALSEGRPRRAPRALHANAQLRHWFEEAAIDELHFLRELIDSEARTHVRTFLRCVFSSIIVAASRQ